MISRWLAKQTKLYLVEIAEERIRKPCGAKMTSTTPTGLPGAPCRRFRGGRLRRNWTARRVAQHIRRGMAVGVHLTVGFMQESPTPERRGSKMAITQKRRVLTQQRLADPDVAIRFWSKVQRTDSCWLWMASKDGRGYGMFSLYGHGAAPEKSHRVAFVIANGPIPEGQEVCHRCDTPSCVRPDHLFTGSHLDNMLNASRKGRMDVKSKGKPGSLNNSSKLHESDIPTIRELRKQGKSQTYVAAIFGVHRTTISLIDRGIHWK